MSLTLNIPDISQVKVMSDPTIEQGDGLVNLAYHKPTTQSSTGKLFQVKIHH